MFESGLRTERPGNKKSLPADSSLARLRISTARGGSGTRCSRLVFVRAAGMVHIAPPKSISSRRAPSTSPVRAAVRIRNSEREFRRLVHAALAQSS
jgi:hypothetical protein